MRSEKHCFSVNRILKERTISGTKVLREGLGVGRRSGLERKTEEDRGSRQETSVIVVKTENHCEDG